MLHRSALLDHHALVDQHGEVQLPLIKSTGRGDVVGAEAQMIQGHGVNVAAKESTVVCAA